MTFDGTTGVRLLDGFDDDDADRTRDDFCFSALRFTAPKDAEDRGDSKVCTARAYLLPTKGALRFALVGASVAKVTHSRRDAHTAFIHIAGDVDHRHRNRHNGTPTFGEFLVDLDARVLQVAQSNTDVWFMHKMNADLVEEYYRGCSGPAGGTQGRFVLAAESLPPDFLLACADGGSPPRLDLQLQLVGLQFRPQYFTCVWKLASARLSPTPLPTPPVEPARGTDDDLGVPVLSDKKAASKKQKPAPPVQMPLFRDDDDDDDDEDSDDEIGPSAEERAELRNALKSKLLMLESDELGRIEALRVMIRRLDGSSLNDLGVIGDIEEMLSL